MSALQSFCTAVVVLLLVALVVLGMWAIMVTFGQEGGVFLLCTCVFLIVWAVIHFNTQPGGEL